ncbi:hypothetical protein Vafri_10839 [Volvox africanus]|uniref:NAD-dependent epimerase/dehydratase domain-containing protein n=1 Tax=Volvox africanus TaxID=51714 RepID=A0A8J4B754_9CHLO|nr:hypothetical protein Vafri_10839 [Volvox africanus]
MCLRVRKHSSRELPLVKSSGALSSSSALSAQKALLRPLAASGRIAWFGYLSSTGVYGDWQGEWVDESSPCRQTSSKAIVRQEAEAAWLQMYEQHGLPSHVFRLGGIYGPGRSVLDTLQREMSELSMSQQRRGRQRYTARCHVHDICAVLTASILKPRPGGVYNVVDDDSAPRTEVMSYARSLLAGQGQGQGSRSSVAGEEEPPVLSAREGQSSERIGINGTVDTHSQSAGRGRGSGPEPLEEKRVRNRLVKSELGVKLRYPTYREGVAAIHRRDYWPLSQEDLRMLS